MAVVVVGSCMTDLVSYVPRLPKPGETLHGHRFIQGFGGKGANQCIVAARLGAPTSMVAKLGTDTFGQNYIDNLKRNEINIDHVGMSTTASTGVATIAVDESGQNSIVIVSGANLELSPEDVQRAEAQIAAARVVVCQLEVRPEVSLHALKLAKKHGVMTILNPAPAQSSLNEEMYRHCDVFCPNETEAEILCGQPVSTVTEAERAIGIFLERGCKAVVLTMGELGVVFASQTQPKPVHIPAKKVKVVDSTGAGDAFVGSLAYFLSQDVAVDIASCLQKCVDIATVSVQAPGTQTSFPLRKDLPENLFE